MNIEDVTPTEIETLVNPALLSPLSSKAYNLLAAYVMLVYRWNRRINLTAIRDPKIFIELHLSECLRCAQLLPPNYPKLMDFGSGVGLPGIPISIARPEIPVTLTESQAKKAAFLREAIRELSLSHTVVHACRVQDLPPEQTFDVLTVRAVDKMGEALQAAYTRIRNGGWCIVLTSVLRAVAVRGALPVLHWMPAEPIPGTHQRIVLRGYKSEQ